MIDQKSLNSFVTAEIDKLRDFMHTAPEQPATESVLRLYCGDYFTIPGTKNHMRFTVSFFTAEKAGNDDRWVFDIDIEPLDKNHSTSAKVKLGNKEELTTFIDSLAASDLEEKISDLSDECDRFYWP